MNFYFVFISMAVNSSKGSITPLFGCWVIKRIFFLIFNFCSFMSVPKLKGCCTWFMLYIAFRAMNDFHFPSQESFILPFCKCVFFLDFLVVCLFAEKR